MKNHPLASALASTARLVSGVKPMWMGCEPSASRRVYFANHTSHLDAVVLWSCLPPVLRANTRPVAARDYWQRGRVRPYLAARVFRALLIDRVPPADAPRGPSAVDVMLEALDESSLILFPEGTRGRGDVVAPFRAGLYKLASARPDVEFVPVHLENLNRILPKGEVLPVPLLSRAHFGTPMHLASDEPRDAFLERARAAVEALGAS
ncbi:MAG TPA: lysophospholipid acyltransferase family protein [Candidatus Binatia bacterium]|nr:lysophospholipid acyltransferase family protein [Candidatus Binatia bacterium]